LESLDYLEQQQQKKITQQQQLSNQIAYINFINAIKSPATRNKYSYLFEEYLKYLDINNNTNLENLLSKNVRTIENDIVKYIIDLKKNKGLSYSSLNTKLAAIYLFYTMNDVIINRKKLGKYLGEHIKTIKDRGYTISEIKKIIDTCGLKYKIAVTIMASCGCRIGAIPNLTKSSLKYHEKYQLYQITFYENTKEEYYSFVSPECSNYIREYLNFRERSGEKLNDNSPLIRDDFVVDDLLHIENPKFLSLDAYHKYLKFALVRAGIRSLTSSKKRKEISLNHGFRKFAMTTMSHAKINVEIREMLLGHSIGLGDSYYRPNVNEMLSEYLKVVDDLTIDEKNRLKKENQELKENKQETEYMIKGQLQEVLEQNKILSSKIQEYEEAHKEGRIMSKELAQQRKEMDQKFADLYNKIQSLTVSQNKQRNIKFTT
jgi:integrase